MSKEAWQDKNYSYFCNHDCEFFPCHPTENPDNFNCLFCFCPLYLLGSRCGGNFIYLENGCKDCSPCLLPHLRENYGMIIDKCHEINALFPPQKS